MNECRQDASDIQRGRRTVIQHSRLDEIAKEHAQGGPDAVLGDDTNYSLGDAALVAHASSTPTPLVSVYATGTKAATTRTFMSS